MTAMPNYAPADGHSQLMSYHAPADVYAYLLAFAADRQISRNKAITEIISEHRKTAEARAARAAKKAP